GPGVALEVAHGRARTRGRVHARRGRLRPLGLRHHGGRGRGRGDGGHEGARDRARALARPRRGAGRARDARPARPHGRARAPGASGGNAYKEMVADQDAERIAGALLDAIARELQDAQGSTIAFSPATPDAITFRRMVGYDPYAATDAGKRVLSQPITLRRVA